MPPISGHLYGYFCQYYCTLPPNLKPTKNLLHFTPKERKRSGLCPRKIENLRGMHDESTLVGTEEAFISGQMQYDAETHSSFTHEIPISNVFHKTNYENGLNLYRGLGKAILKNYFRGAC